MKNKELFGLDVTQSYACLIRNEVLLKYPNFFFDKGVIWYDYDTETYIYTGYSDEELKIIQEAVKSLQKN